MSDKRVSEMTDDEIQQLAGARRYTEPATAQAIARHVKAALLHLRQAEDLADAAGIDLDSGTHSEPGGTFRSASGATQDLDGWAIENARQSGAPPAETYAHTERWCHAPGGTLPHAAD